MKKGEEGVTTSIDRKNVKSADKLSEELAEELTLRLRQALLFTAGSKARSGSTLSKLWASDQRAEGLTSLLGFSRNP